MKTETINARVYDRPYGSPRVIWRPENYLSEEHSREIVFEKPIIQTEEEFHSFFESEELRFYIINMGIKYLYNMIFHEIASNVRESESYAITAADFQMIKDKRDAYRLREILNESGLASEDQLKAMNKILEHLKATTEKKAKEE